MSQLKWNDPTALINAATDASVKAIADDLQGNIVNEYSRKQHSYWTDTPSAPGEPPAMISGHLAASVQTKPIQGGQQVYTTAVYARIHEFGGTIYAHGKALTVPIGAAGKRFLVAAANGGWRYAMRFYQAFVTPKGIVVSKVAGGPIVALRQSVQMPERPAWKPAIEQTTKDAESIIKAAWKKVMP